MCLRKRLGPKGGYKSKNLQIESCINGFEEARKLNIPYTLKTRSDKDSKSKDT